MKIKVGVLYGGKTTEHEVSIITAVQAMGFLNEEKYEVIPMYLTKENELYTGAPLKEMDVYKEQDLLKVSCLTENQLFDYCNLESGKPFYAIHISKLEIFDEPKELSEFYYYCKDEKCEYRKYHCSICYRKPLTKARRF